MSRLIFLRAVREEMPFEPTEEEERIAGEHFAYLQQLRAAGKLLLAGPSPVPGDTTGIEVEVEDEAEVQAIATRRPASI